MDRHLKNLHLFLEHGDARRPAIGLAAAGAGTNETKKSDSRSSEKPDEWMLEWGPPTDMLQLTRGQIFNQLLRLRDDERQRIGQELHDSAGQLLVALQLSVACLRETESGGEHKALVDEIQETARLIGQEIRSLAFINHPITLNGGGLASALQSLIEGFGRRTGCRTRFKTIGLQTVQSDASSMALLRVAQEALVNIHRHAHASSVSASLKQLGDSLEFTICDDGIGMPPVRDLAIDQGVGVEGMRFRVEQLGGRFQIRKLKRGTKILARVPLAA